MRPGPGLATIDVEALITDRFSLDQAADAYAQLSAGRIIGRAVIDIQAT